MPSEGVGEVPYDHQKLLKAKGNNHYYFWSIVYLLRGSQDQNFAFEQLQCNFIVKKNCRSLWSCIMSEYNNGSDYIDKMKLKGHTWGNEDMISATVTDDWQRHCNV